VKISKFYVYTADLNPRFGTEPGKIRPVVVVQTDLLNNEHPSTIVCPITTKNISSNRTAVSSGARTNSAIASARCVPGDSFENHRAARKTGTITISVCSICSIPDRMIVGSGIKYTMLASVARRSQAGVFTSSHYR